MNYEETLNYLYTSAPLFQHIGAAAYKEGLYNTKSLDEHFGHPHRKYRTIHIAGTNGKGSCAHTIASILQEAGYKVGLYTSPHLVDFRERIRINGEMISQQDVIDFVKSERYFFEPLHPSFFELTTALAFVYFARQQVDVAVIEVGMGGRLDCTNIISSTLSVITNISFDHTQFLGNTLGKIAEEKAGIIKKGVPVVIGETVPETRCVFEAKAKNTGAPIVFAEDDRIVKSSFVDNKTGGRIYQTTLFSTQMKGELGGDYQEKNMNTILCSIVELTKLGFSISEHDIRIGVANVCEATGLKGRWDIISKHPTIVLDTGHNTGGLEYNIRQLENMQGRQLRVVFGMVADKDIDGILKLLPRSAIYYFTRADIKRALDEKNLCDKAKTFGLTGLCYPSVQIAAKTAIQAASKDDIVYIGGSNFIVGDFLKSYKG